MKIYIVAAHDFHFNRGHNVRNLKAFKNLHNAEEFKGLMKCKLDEWKNSRPEYEAFHKTEKEKEWLEHNAKHPCCFEDGFAASYFQIIALELE